MKLEMKKKTITDIVLENVCGVAMPEFYVYSAYRKECI